MKFLMNMRAKTLLRTIFLLFISLNCLMGANYDIKEIKNTNQLAGIKQQAPEEWISLLYKNQTVLNSRLENSPNQTSGQKETIQIIKNKADLLPDSIRLILISNIFDVSLYSNDTNQYTGFIEDNLILQILIEALKDSDQNIRNRALSYILNYAKINMLKEYSVTVKNNIEKNDYNNKALLMGLLVLTPEEKSTLLSQNKTPEIVTARIGNPELQAKFINQFAQAKTYKEKYEAAEQLGYIGTSKCAESLIKGLDSDLKLEALYEHVSIKYIIIKTLGRIYPDEPLFTTEINKIAEMGDDRYGGNTAIKMYLSKISEWSYRKFKIRPGIKPDTFIYKRILVKKPLRN